MPAHHCRSTIHGRSTIRRWRRGAAGLALLLAPACLLPLAVAAQDLEDSLEVVESTSRSAEQSQQKIDQLSRETRNLLEEYRRLTDSADYQQAYSAELEQLAAQQQERIGSLKQQLAQARITRQRILPLMRSMADALEKFVVLDLPFHQEERVTAVLQLKQRLGSPELSVAARFRLLLEAFQIEQAYGSSVEAWRGPLQRVDETLSVEYLRLGRVALYYLSLDRQRAGIWDRDKQAWQVLDSAHHRGLSRALRVARGQAAPQLLELPLTFPGEEP
jgi:hypothetical protein